MAKFLNISATSYFLEQLIKDPNGRVVFIAPYFRLNDRESE